MALILPGEPNDTGYNYMYQTSLTKTESILQTEFSLTYKNLEETMIGTEIAIEDAISKGANLIIISSTIHTKIAFKYAEKYKNQSVYWLIQTPELPTSDLPKVAILNFKKDNLLYVLGYFSGLSTKTGTVGFLSPSSIYNVDVNSFYLGAIDARPNITFLNVYTGSWLNPEVSYNAAKELISQGADFIGMNQDDMSVQRAVIESGSLGLGSTCFPNHKLYGATIGLSYVANWTDVLMKYAKHIQDDTWPSYDYYQTSLANGGSLSFDEYSYMVPQSVRSIVDSKIEALKNKSYEPYKCNKMYSIFGYSFDSNGCISETDYRNSTLLQGNYKSKVIDLKMYTIPLEFIGYPLSITYGISIVSGFCILLTIVSIILVIIFRRAKIIRSASPIFCVLILVGCIIIFCGTILFSQSPTNDNCRSRVWCLSVGFTILLGALLVKNFRIWLLFDNPKLKRRMITNYTLYPWVTGILAIDLLILSIWQSLGNIKSISKMGIDSLTKYQYSNVCTSNSTGTLVLYILIVFHGLMLLVACFISFKIKSVDIPEFNEFKPIGTTVYVITFCLFIVIPLMISPQSITGQTTIICVCAIVTTCMGIGLLFGSKFYKMFTEGLKLNETFATSTSKSSSSFSNSLEKKVVARSDSIIGGGNSKRVTVPPQPQSITNQTQIENSIQSSQIDHMATFTSDSSSSSSSSGSEVIDDTTFNV